MKTTDIMDQIAAAKIVPVVVLERTDDALAAADALYAGGIGVMEITFRTAAAPEAIRRVAVARAQMLVGAGTVTTLEQCKTAVSCGAKFLVSPGFDQEIVRWCIERSIPVMPGCVTPSEIMAARRLGLRVLKFFPANVYGGLQAMKSLSAPFGDVRFVPTGGVHTDNIAEYIAAPFVHAVGGSWICPQRDIAAGNFPKITQLCQEALAQANRQPLCS